MGSGRWPGFCWVGDVASGSSAIRPMPKRENRSMWVAGIGDADDAVEIVDEAGKQARKVRGLVDPLLPSEAEIREHKLTHLPFRNR